MSTQVLEKKPIVADKSEESQAYSDLCEDVGVTSPKTRHRSLRTFLAENNICEYDPQMVHAFLKEKAKAQGMDYLWLPLRKKDRHDACLFQHQEMNQAELNGWWGWLCCFLATILFLGGLMIGGICLLMDGGIAGGIALIVGAIVLPLMVLAMGLRPASYGTTRQEVYNDLVPTSALLTVRKTQKSFPDAHFFVSEVRARERRWLDPFLAVTFPGQPFTIIEWWSEPGFKP